MVTPSHTSHTIWRSPKAYPRSWRTGTTESTPAAPITTSEPAKHLGQVPWSAARPRSRAGPRARREAHRPSLAEAVRHRLDRLPGRHGLSRIGAVKSDDRRHAGVEDHAARDEHDGPDEPHGRRRLGQDRGRVLQACVERQRQDGQDDAEDDLGD